MVDVTNRANVQCGLFRSNFPFAIVSFLGGRTFSSIECAAISDKG